MVDGAPPDQLEIEGTPGMLQEGERHLVRLRRTATGSGQFCRDAGVKTAVAGRAWQPSLAQKLAFSWHEI